MSPQKKEEIIFIQEENFEENIAQILFGNEEFEEFEDYGDFLGLNGPLMDIFL